MTYWTLLFTALSLVALTACDGTSADGADTDVDTDAEDTDVDTDAEDTDDTDDDGTLEIVGDYADDFGGTHNITDVTWTQEGFGAVSVFHFLEVDNPNHWASAQNDASNPYNPDLYSMFHWTTEGTDLYFCQSAFDAASQPNAEATTADAGDLAAGCGSFGWSKLTETR